jgi:hypothetical protein
MVRIDQMSHCYKDTVILLNLDIIAMKIIVKGRTCVLHLLISPIHILVSGFILVLYVFNQSGEEP